MIAAELQTSLPLVNRRTNALVAGRLIAHRHLDALVFADEDGRPRRSIAASEVLDLMASPDRMPSDADLRTQLSERTIGDLIDDRRFRATALLTVRPDTPVEVIASEMVDAGAHVAIVIGDSAQPMFITLPDVMEGLLALSGDLE